jgi:N-acetylmuramoyl-L-alanine amidase
MNRLCRKLENARDYIDDGAILIRSLWKNACLLWLLCLPWWTFCCATARPVTQASPAKNIRINRAATVVIDAGHGGEDSGALGRQGLKEKDITLQVAKKIAQFFKKHDPHIRVIFTRKYDNYVSLEDRINIAHAQKAHLFISLHVNSSDQKDANGFEIYSLDVASDRHAERLAARENKGLSPGKNPADLILADLRAFSYRKESDQLAAFISKGLHHQLKKHLPEISINNRGYKQAIFQVLFVNSPAVLCELFFLSNPRDEALLRNNDVLTSVAAGIYIGAKNFLDKRSNDATKS